MKLKVVLNTTGITLKYISLLFIFPVIFAFLYKEALHSIPFIVSGILSYLLGCIFSLNDASEKDIDNMSRLEAFATVVFAWFVTDIICTIPFLFFGLSPINALFEAVSGVSTTGATILTDFTIYPKVFFFFRSLSQWFGGMGIIVLFIAVLPKFAVAGRQMFFAESPNPTEEKITPRIRHTASWLWSIYILLTIIQILLLKTSGCDLYSSICIALSTVSAGGFSHLPTGLIGFNDKLIWIIGFFSFLAGVNFLLTYKVLIKGKITEIFKSEEFRFYFLTVLITTLIITGVLAFEAEIPIKDAIRNAFFEVSATITSTGFSSTDYISWPIRAQITLFVLMFIGASAISASGSIKIARWIYITKFIKRELNKIAHPALISPVKLEKKTVAPDVGYQIIIFIMFYFAIFAISSFITAFIENDTSIAFTGSIATLSNTGPAFDALIGPLGSYEKLHTSTKLIFIFNMFIGRLEIIPFLALFHKDLWQFRK